MYCIFAVVNRVAADLCILRVREMIILHLVIILLLIMILQLIVVSSSFLTVFATPIGPQLCKLDSSSEVGL